MEQEPRSLPRQDLSSVFARSSSQTPSRTEGIPKLERPAHRAVTVPAPQPDETAHETPDPAPTRLTPPVAPSVEDEPGPDGKVNYQVALEETVRKALKHERERTGLTMATIVLDAIDNLIDTEADDPLDHLRQLVRTDLGLDSKPKSLFSREPERAAATVADLGHRQPQLLRLTKENKAALQDLVTQVGAVDRGHLVSVALRDYLKISKAGNHDEA